MKIAIIGRTQLLYKTARLFLEKGHQIVLVVTSKAAPEYTVTEDDFRLLAEECGAPFLMGAELARQADTVKKAGAQLAISMNWPNILGDDIISQFPLGILNAHPGDLPRYRGNACPNWAIINGESEVVLTIHRMAPGELDSGDILLKGHIPLDRGTTIGEVYTQLEEMMPTLYLNAAEGLQNGTLSPQTQSTNPADILRVYPRLGQDSFLDWNRPALELERLVHASSAPFAGAYTYYNGKKLVVLSAIAGTYPVPSQAAAGQVVAINRQTGAVSVATGSGFLTLTSIEYSGQVHPRPSELIRSMRARLGMMNEDEIAALVTRVEELEIRLARLEAHP